MKKILSYIFHPSKIIIYFASRNKIRISDERYLKMLYKLIIGKKLNLDNPKTFNEKLQWLKLNDRKDIYTMMVDKYEVKKYILDIIGEEFVIPTIGIYNSFDEINFDELPEQFVMKCTHDSGGVVIVKDKSNFDKIKARKKLEKSLNLNFYYLGREWPYKNVKPRIIIEKYMGDNLNDYKIMCFNGNPYYSFVCSDRSSEKGLHVTFFNDKWEKMNFERHYPSSKEEIVKPLNFDKMLELSKKLSRDIPFVRVDWYEIDNKIFFGELTFYPGGGFEEFSPIEWDYKLGELIDLEGVKDNEKGKNN